ncbi:saccharopine dehydrogenase-like oxidoreductase [Auriculariales sp. MPI-PUGE-AT-0066]|nr:saccharopine dehydrogenase-like oxidoreductase [Auriculariales sp. MPI-PUGE-AT-0066]
MPAHIPRSILVLGAGELGTAVLRSLAVRSEIRSANCSLHVLLRPSTAESTDPTKKAQVASFKALNISIVKGDLSVATSAGLSQLFRTHNIDTVIGCTGFTEDHSLQLKIAQGVYESGTVKRYFPWQFGVEYDLIGRQAGFGLFADQLDVRDLIRKRQASVEWVIVSTGMFMSFIFEEFFGVLHRDDDKLTVRALGSWDTKVTLTAVEDIGALTAAIVFDPAVSNQVVYVAGQTLSYGQFADIVGEFAPLQKEEWTMNHLMAELEKDTQDQLKKYRVVFGEGTGVSWDETETYNIKRGLKTTCVKEWIQAHPAVLTKG